MYDFKITKREILVSIAIVCVMILFGTMITGKISENIMAKNQEYYTALQIVEDQDLFEYGMRTNVGNAFVYGELIAVDPVTFPEIDGSYSYILKVKERYTKHERIVTKTRTTSDGDTETYTEIEEYWTWDEIDRWSKHAKTISFVNVEFDYGKIDFPARHYIKTIKESSRIRYVYYGEPIKSNGTLYAVLKENDISNVRFFHNATITETIEFLDSYFEIYLFWALWILLIGGVIFCFYYIDNQWLEDKNNKDWK